MATMTLDDLSAQLSRAFGDQLVAVVLYGSAARGEHVARRSDFNVLVMVRTLAPAALRAAAATAHAWHAAGNPPPLILTEAEWRSSRDVFAIEFADILERHRVLTGAFPDGPRTVDPAHLRHQLEFEAMGKLLRLRRGILACNGDATRGARVARGRAERRAACSSARCCACRASRRRRASEAVVRRAADTRGVRPGALPRRGRRTRRGTTRDPGRARRRRAHRVPRRARELRRPRGPARTPLTPP